MSPSALSYASVVLVAIIAAGLFALGHLRARRRETAPQRIAGKEARSMLSMMEAATAAYDTAKRERMVIAWVAENARNSPDPVAWFAQSIAGVVPTYRMSEPGVFERTERMEGVGTELQSLYIRRRNYRTYVDWARGMQ